MRPSELTAYLRTLIEHDLRHAVMLWGKPGIGKSSIVRALAESLDMGFVDVRLSQLMPSDLRGVPVPAKGTTRWAPPSFLPVDGQGVLFLDEINMAPPALQGVAQQLILDRAVGDYVLPDGWFVWAAGNRADDRAAVYDMPGPLANRFVHLEAELSLEDFKRYAFGRQLDSTIIGFLSFRPDLLHRFHPDESAWPSPRTWEMAAALHAAGLSVEPAVGPAAAVEFDAFHRLRSELPDIAAILAGRKKAPPFPEDPSVRYATISALVGTIETLEQAVHGFEWVIGKAPAEWVQLFAMDLFPELRERKLYAPFSAKIVEDPRAVAFIAEFAKLAA